MRFPDLADLLARLRFSTRDGRIWLDDQRMLLIHAKSLGALRREMIEVLGMDVARGFFTRMGYRAGVQNLSEFLCLRHNVIPERNGYAKEETETPAAPCR